MKKSFFFFLFFFFFLLPLSLKADSSVFPQLQVTLGSEEGNNLADAVKIFLLISFLSLGPALLLTMTSFTRIIIVLSFLRQAIGVHQSPPNQVILGLAAMLTFFLMSPVFSKVHTNAIDPLFKDQITIEKAGENAALPLKEFMLSHTRKKDLDLAMHISKTPMPEYMADLPLLTVIPAFIISELRTAFEIGFLIYLPFVLIDMIVAMVLLTMGMMVLPPVIISMPFKLMLFVLVDGWNLIVGSLVKSFRVG